MEGWKRCTALLAAALLSLSFAACGKDGGGDITPTKLEGMVKEAYDGTDYSAYLGIWDGVVNDGEPEQKLIAAPDEDGEPRWVLYVGGELACSGFLQVRPQYANAVYAYVEQEGCGYLCWFDSYGALHIELDLDGNSCVLVPEGTVPGWQTDGGDVAGADWRTTGIVRAEGTVTRGGEDRDVLVCVHAENAALYYDAAEQVLYAAVDYHAAIQGDAWAAFQSIDFADRNGDGSSDIAMLFQEGDGMTLLVWFWDETAKRFVFRPEESSAASAAAWEDAE